MFLLIIELMRRNLIRSLKNFGTECSDVLNDMLQGHLPMQTSTSHPGHRLPSGTEFGSAERGAFRFASVREPSMETTHGSGNSGSPPTPGLPSGRPANTRPRGRKLIACLMLAACGGGIYSVWDTLLRYEAYGVVTGRTIDVSAPLDGVLRYVHVREGDIVNQNARLATVFDLECEQKLQRIADELRVADATLHAEMARIRWQSHVDDTEVTRSMADFFEASGLVCQESGTLDILRDQLQRSRLANEKNAVPASELETRTILERAHNEKLESLRQSLEVLRKRAEGVAQVPRPGIEQMADRKSVV